MGRPSLDVTSAQFSVVHFGLEALRHVCYDVPDFLHIKVLALNAGDIPVPQASEMYASYNCADVVKWSLIPQSWLFVL
jgi:hypothetical protein